MGISKEKRSIIFLLVIFLIVIGIVVLVALSIRVDPVKENIANELVLNSLWIMKDDDENVLSTYVLICNPNTNQAGAFNVQGNTGAIYNSIGRVDRIDTIYREKGSDVYRSEVEKLIGKTIPFEIELRLSDLGFITDYLGGLNIFVPFPIDEVFSEEEKHYLIPSGAVLLDGDKICDYMTYKGPSEDLSDINDRRQAVFVALLDALHENRGEIFLKKNFLLYEKKIRSNISGKNLYNLMQIIASIDIDKLSVQGITGSIRNVDGQLLLFPYYDGQLIKDVVNLATSALVSGDRSVQNRVYVLIIQNGTTEQGLARNTSFLMQSAGYEVLETANADRSDYEQTQIINHIGDSEAATALGNFIHCDNIIEEEVLPESADLSSAAKADFTIILGKDFNGRFVQGGGKSK